MLEWKPNLKWSDFPVKVDPAAKTTTKNLDYDALTSCTFLYKINNAYNYPPALIIAYMNKPESYRKDHILNNYEQLLEHEQGHFNMAKQHEEMAKDSIAKLWGKKVEEIDSTIKYFIGKLDREGSVYDSLTNHGLNTLQQREWTKKLKIL
ncbi:MAG: hypothetical protein JWQ14_2145 [Adhaeribacter sp.]|nr:hypothetical protein [Adhaeribacter sp.]